MMCQDYERVDDGLGLVPASVSDMSHQNITAQRISSPWQDIAD